MGVFIVDSFLIIAGRLGSAENWNDVTIVLLVIVFILFVGFIAILVYLFRYRKRFSKYDLDS